MFRQDFNIMKPFEILRDVFKQKWSPAVTNAVETEISLYKLRKLVNQLKGIRKEYLYKDALIQERQAVYNATGVYYTPKEFMKQSSITGVYAKKFAKKKQYLNPKL